MTAPENVTGTTPLPDGCIVHQSPGRVRFKIRECRGQDAFFNQLQSVLQKEARFDLVEISPLTGSVLATGDVADVPLLAKICEEFSLCKIRLPEKPVPIVRRIADPITAANQKVSQFSGGSMDMPGLVFLSALAFGVYEILRGNFRTPPWYTAFWYAFGVYSKSYFDQKSDPESRK